MANSCPNLGPRATGHLARLIGAWGFLADLCFADLLLFGKMAGSSRFMVLGQVRPTTHQTLYVDDMVGSTVGDQSVELLEGAFTSGEILDGTLELRNESVHFQCIPVVFGQEPVAVMARVSLLAVGRRPGGLGRNYMIAFERFARMISTGLFPYRSAEKVSVDAPRVGDGAALLDASGRITYASPNANNALHRIGVMSTLEGARLDELGVDEHVVDKALADHGPASEEVELSDATVMLRVLPMLQGGHAVGALLLLRDVTEVRVRDRLLLSKDATIREIHHRVKNNLQTIGSLLRLQARRLDPGAGREALLEAERRIRSIALVHDILSREATESVSFDEILEMLVRIAAESLVPSDEPVQFTHEGSAGRLAAEVATPLAVVLTELLQNAVEHGFPSALDRTDRQEDERADRVHITIHNDGETLSLAVHDNGRGFPEGFQLGKTRSLGVLICRQLIVDQLGGTMELENERGALVLLRVPVPSEGSLDMV